MKKILVTGATGFVGSHIVSSLLAKSKNIKVVVRTGKEGYFKGILLTEDIVVTDDILSESVDSWEQICKDVDTIIHLAWYAEPGRYLHSPLNLDYLSSTLALAKGAAKAGVSKFIGIGTCLEYDLSYGFLSVDTPLKPLTLYSAAKASLYLTLNQWFALHQMKFSWCRIFYLYGQGEDPRRLVPYIRSKVSIGEIAELRNGNLIRDYVDVKIAAEMIVNVAISDTTGPVNICSGVPISIRQFAENIADEYGRRDLLVFKQLESSNEPLCIVGAR